MSDLFGFASSIPGILVVAWLGRRLLGARLRWTSALLAGVVGWLAATGLSLIIAGNDTNAPGFERNVWVFSVVFTMSALVWLELLAKPGSLARAQARALQVPHPIRNLRRRASRVRRYGQIVGIAVKHGLAPYLGLHGQGEEEATASATLPRRLRRALEEGGGMFVKLGQVLSTRPDLLPKPFLEELSRLQDQVAVVPVEEMRALLEAELGGPVDHRFASFDWDPVAAASIGQAYRGRLVSGEEVVVKVQRPGIEALVGRDIEVLLELARSAEARVRWAAEYKVVELAEEFAERLREELDFSVEARHAGEIAANLVGLPEVRIPKVYPQLSTTRVLTMEWLEGTSVRRVDRLDDLGFDRSALADVLLRASLQQMLVDGRFHADPHPGNIMVLSDGRIGLIDFGAASRLDPLQQASVRQMLVAIAEQSPTLLRQALLEVAEVPEGFDDLRFERALARFMARRLGPGAMPDAAMINELFQLLFGFRITVPSEFSTFFRALVTLEGTVTTLSPGYPVIEEAEKLASEWAVSQLEPAALADTARKEALTLLPILRRMPYHLDRISTLVERGDFTARVSLLSNRSDLQALSRLVNRVVLALLGGVVGILSVMLLGIEGGPTFTGDTSLFQFFGYFGLFCATVLILRVLLAVMREGPD